ncbi:MAG: tetratricopeptide repeat protein [Bacteroidales bacterium]
MDKNFFNAQEDENGEPDFSYAIDKYMQACKLGCEVELTFTEEEFEYIIEYFIDKNEEEQVLKVSELAFSKHPYSSMLLVKFCDSLIIAGLPDRAIDVLNGYKDSFDKNSDIYFLFARAYIRKKLFTEARDYFAMAVETDFKEDDIIDSICSIGQDCIDLENYAEALFYLNKATSMQPLNYEYYNDYAFCYDKLDDTKKALEYYNKYLDSDPFNDYVWFNVGTVYARRKEFDKAVEAFEYSLALNNLNDASLYNLAVVYLNLERYKDALDNFKLCYDLDGHSAVASLGLADAYLGLKDLGKAKDFFKEALVSDKNCEEAKMGYECVLAIEQYMKGERIKFIEQMRVLAKQDSTWVNTVYTIFPQLGSDGDFLNLLTETKKDGNN